MKRYKHSLSNFKLFSCDMGELVPCGLMEVLPGDSIQQATNMLVRASPLLSPVMHPVNVRIHHWFVPHRLVWDSWEDFITGGPDGMDDSVFPTQTSPASTGYAVGSLADYLGIPTGVPDLEHSMLPFRGYALIWNEWYRDQDLQTPVAVAKTDGDDNTTSVALQNCCWEKDYFTSAREWEQKGPAVTVPIGNTADVTLAEITPGSTTALKGIGAGSVEGAILQTSSAGPATGTNVSIGNITTGPNSVAGNQLFTRLGDIAAGIDGTADLSTASLVTVNVLREALAIQRYEEARARYGSRYTEYLQYLGVRSSDGRLQRPEYLGGGQNTVQFSEVLQTAEGSNAVGTLRGHGISAMRSNRYRRFFEEHGYVFTLVSIRPKTIYGNGLPRTWNRRVKEDFWQKELEHIGQQEVLNKEVYGAHSDPNDTFGYQDRYDEYRRIESTIGGEFRTTDLNFWHMARIFASDPSLNSDFVKCVPTERTFAVPSKDVFLMYAKHSTQARRLVCQKGNSWTY